MKGSLEDYKTPKLRCQEIGKYESGTKSIYIQICEPEIVSIYRVGMQEDKDDKKNSMKELNKQAKGNTEWWCLKLIWKFQRCDLVHCIKKKKCQK